MRLKCHCCPNELCYASVKGRNLRRLKLVPGRTNINHRRFHLESSMQHFQSDFAVVSANGIRDRGAKAQGGTPCTGFSSWTQFVAMVFCQLGHAQSLREITGGLAACEGKLRHLGVEDTPKRSTLSYANQHRPWQLFESVFYRLLARCQAEALGQKRKFRFKHKLLSIDSTVIPLCLSMFDWALYKRAKGAVKLHMVLDHDGYLPHYAVLTDGKTSDITTAKKMSFAPGTMLVFDRGYTRSEERRV